MEDHLVLDELFLIHESINKAKREQFRMLAAAQGHDIEADDEEEFGGTVKGDELPPELLAAERKWQIDKEEHRKAAMQMEMAGLGLGYSTK